MKNLHNLGAMQWWEGDMRALPMRVHSCHQGNRWRTQFFPHTLKWTGVFAHSQGMPTTQPKRGHPACVPFCGHWTMRLGKTIFIMRLLKPIHQRIFYLINLQTILRVNFLLSPFHRWRNRGSDTSDIQITQLVRSNVRISMHFCLTPGPLFIIMQKDAVSLVSQE